MELGSFIDFCTQYLEGDGGMIVDMHFLPHIAEVGFSATLFSGAEYTYDEPAKWKGLVEMSWQACRRSRSALADTTRR